MNYLEIFHQIEPSLGSAFNAKKLPNVPHLIGKTDGGCPIFFIKNRETAKKSIPLNMEWLQVAFDAKCSIKEQLEVIDCRFSTILFDSEDEVLQTYFINIMEAILEEIPSKPSSEELLTCIMNLIQIFSAKNNVPQKKIQGLWAEMAVIYLSKNPKELLSAWHSDPKSKVDFSNGTELIEVKSTQSEIRKHSFSLDQLNPAIGLKELIASMVVRESGQGELGLSIEDLRKGIQDRITDNKLNKKMYTVILETLGKDYNQASSLYFSLSEARATLKYYEITQIPHIGKINVPSGVSEVRFTSDLSGSIDISQLQPEYDLTQTKLFSNLCI